MNSPAIKDVEITSVRHQIGRIKARDGSWVLAQVLTKMLPAVIEAAFKKNGAQLAGNRAALSEEEFASIQGIALAVCRRYENNNLPLPVFVLPDAWAAKDLEYDVVTLMALTIHALTLNLTLFFEGGGLSQMRACLRLRLRTRTRRPPNLDSFLFRPVAAGLCTHRDLVKDVFSFADLLDAHEILDVKAENERRRRE